MRATCIALIVVVVCIGSDARKTENHQADSLEKYLARISPVQMTVTHSSSGSLWVDGGPLSSLAADYKARHVGDVVVVQIVEQVTATNASSVNTQRKFQANSGIAALAGKFNTSGISTLFSPESSSQLQGQGQAAMKTSIRTSVGGRVAAMLPNGNLVIEARREAMANNERQTVVLRGVARAGDITPENSVLSTQLSDLEVELKGHGVMSDASRPPNWVVRTILKVLGF